MPTSRKTIGVIGLGSIGMRHAKNLLAMGHRVLGYDTDSAKMKAFLLPANGEVGWFRPETDSPVLDARILALPSNQHVVEMLETPPHTPIFVEKPIGVTEGDAVFIKQLIDSPRPIMVGNNLRFHSCVKKAKEWLDAGLIGKPLWSNFTLAQYNDKYTDDVILNWGAHELDLARYLLGPCAVATSVGIRDAADIILLHGDGCQTTVHLDYVTKPHSRYFTIQGTEGFLEACLEKRQANVIDSGDELREQFYGSDDWDSNYIEEMQSFIDLIDGKEVPHAATGADGLAVLELILVAKKEAGIE
jgi:predicted dehydrogenase